MTSSGGEYISPHLNHHGSSHSAAQVNKHMPQPPPAAAIATTPHTQITTTSHALDNNSLISNNASNIMEGVTSYLVASSPEVLTQLLRENESRGIDFNPSLYIQPANALNTTKVDFAINSSGSGGVGGSRNSNSPLLPQSPLPPNKSSHLRHYLQLSASAAQQPMSMPPAFTTAGGGHAAQTNTTTRSQPGSGHSTLSRSGSYGAGSAGSGSLEKRVASWQQRGRKQSLPAMATANSGGLGSSQVEPCLLNVQEFGGWNLANKTNILKEKIAKT